MIQVKRLLNDLYTFTNTLTNRHVAFLVSQWPPMESVDIQLGIHQVSFDVIFWHMIHIPFPEKKNG